jgi:hypothetical protein
MKFTRIFVKQLLSNDAQRKQIIFDKSGNFFK